MLKKIKSVILIDDNDIDVFVNRKILENYGITDITSFKKVNDALLYLKETKNQYHLILIDVYLPIINGFEFIDKFNELELYKTQGEIGVLTASVNPLDKEIALKKNIMFMEKPLTIEKLTLVYNTKNARN